VTAGDKRAGASGGVNTQPGADGSERDEAQWRAERLGRLLAQLSARPSDGESAIRRVVTWLAETVRGAVALADSSGRRLAAAAKGSSVLPGVPSADLMRAVVEGRIHAASVDEGECRLRIVAIGYDSPRAVLTVGLDRRFDEQTTAMMAHAAGVLGLLVQAQGVDHGHRRLEEMSAHLRLAVFQLLMGGDVVLAQRTARGLHPGLLDADLARVYVLESPEDQRDALSNECDFGGHALVVRCPAYEQHLIIVVPTNGGAWDRGARVDEVESALRQLVGARSDLVLGGSDCRPLSQAAVAYGDAIRALAVARFRRERFAMHASQTQLTQLLDPAPTERWAVDLLRPLDELPYYVRNQVLGTVGLGLEFTAVNAAKILGVSRNTVRSRMDKTGELLNVDLDEVASRAVLYLALQFYAAASSVSDASGASGGSNVPSLNALLSTDEIRAWARELLARLGDDDRGLRRTLRTWLAQNASTNGTAQALGVHVHTVRDHIRRAERLLQCQLLAGGSGLYEVALAFAVLGELKMPDQGRQTVHP
jgi:sugar diacid utilization regulator